MSWPHTTTAMQFVHGLYALVTVATSSYMHHLVCINRFLINKVVFFTPSPLEHYKPGPLTPSLTLRMLAQNPDQEHTKSWIAIMRSGFFLFCLLVFLLITPTTMASAGNITIATASNFLQTIKALQQPFTQQTGHRLTIVSGSSGALATQIINGAPFDVFLSGDHQRAQQLVDKGFGDKPSLVTYAYGKLTLWSLDKNLIPGNDGPAVLKAGNFHHIALANPALAPYGLAALETLRSLNLHFNLSNKIIHGENISQTFTMLATGAASIGFAARSQLSREPWKSRGSFWLVPANLHNPIKQSAVIVKHSKNKASARQFMQFLQSGKAAEIITSFGYAPAKP